ncbi:HpcH/HpaI aldolase/citrate lyase family protein [Pseudoduganella namucuonensis]|uniref:Citrate lyase subunit beta / citryl-CoA lyase n=1 Tax=Pseudoduganella namucuonensis TaxID=1035707 RepID=A0A1I7LWY8_9BURK|nr:aldolase/citrate lyase family protein [Pseudoduganella namucuonensis]SFV14192.1 citrate lyase subunit beta / citryl-CoA lyase [Pseudoduganella namucuonensis]
MSTAVHAAPPDARLALAHTFLLLPADRPERYTEACASGADAIIIDLENTVAPSAKAAARAALSDWLDSPAGRAPHIPVLVRVNCVNSGCFGDDLTLCHRPGIAGIVLPRAERVDDVASASSTAPLFPVIETALGFSRMADIATAPRVQRLLFGATGFRADLGIGGGREELLYFRSQIVLASRLAGLHKPVDGVTAGHEDEVQADARHVHRLGFGGKLCAHAAELAPVGRAFAPATDAR